MSANSNHDAHASMIAAMISAAAGAASLIFTGISTVGAFRDTVSGPIAAVTTLANTAITAANTAKNAADTAKTAADTAKTTADTAKTAANKVLDTANNAQSAAGESLMSSKETQNKLQISNKAIELLLSKVFFVMARGD